MKIKQQGKTCRKLEYRSKAQAREGLRALRHTGVRRFYKCPYHGKREVWHLTSSSS